jgi:hypothetical protein
MIAPLATANDKSNAPSWQSVRRPAVDANDVTPRHQQRGLADPRRTLEQRNPTLTLLHTISQPSLFSSCR